MDNKDTIIIEEPKGAKVLLEMTVKANRNVERQQDKFKKRTGGKITKADLINKILETATL